MKIKQADNFFYRILNDTSEVQLCKDMNTSKQKILRNNSKLNYYVGEWVKITTNDYLTHYVQPVENLNDIASKYELSVEKIIADNNLKSTKLFIGQQIRIKKDGG